MASNDLFLRSDVDKGEVSPDKDLRLRSDADKVPGGVDYPISLSAGLTAAAIIDRDVAWDRGMSPGLTVSATVSAVFGRLITTISNLTTSATVAYLVAYKRAIASDLTIAVTILKGWGRKITTSPGLTISAIVAITRRFGRIEQVMFGGYWGSLSTSLNQYAELMGSIAAWDTFETRHRGVISTSGKIKNLRVKLDGDPGAGKHYDFTLMLNGAPTALTLEIADTDTSGANTGTEIDVVAGDTISLLCDPTSSPTARRATWTSMFEGTTANESLILGGLPDNMLDKTSTEYGQPGYCWNPTSTEDNFRVVCPTSGTIKNLYVELDIDPGSGGDAYRFTLRLNGATVAQSLIVTITEPDKTGFDVAHNLAVVAGNVLTMMIEPISTPSETPYAHWGMTFVADTDGESIILSGGVDSPRSDNDEKSALHRGGGGWVASGSEERVLQLGQSCILKKLYMLLATAPGGGKSYTFTLRVPDAPMQDGNLTVTIADTDTTGNSGALEDAIADDDYVDLKSSPTSTPTLTGGTYWGLVSYIAPVVGINYPISLSAGLTAVVTIARDVAWDRGMSPGLTASATVVKGWGRKITTSPGLTISATVDRALAYKRATQAGLTAAVSIVKGWGRAIVTSPGLTISATVLKGWGRAIATTANLTVSVTVVKVRGFFKAVISNLTASATVDRDVAYNRASSPGLTASVSVDRDVSYDRATQPALSVAVTILKGWGRAITTSPGLTISATVLKGWGRAITTSSDLTVAVTIVKQRAKLIVTNTALAVSVTIAKQIAFARSISAGLTASISIAKLRARIIVTTANLVISATIIATFVRITHYLITVAANLTVSATISRTVAYRRAISAGLTIAVNVVKSWGRTITSSANLTISTAISRVVTYTRIISAGLTIAVSIARLIVWTRATTANLKLSIAIIVTFVTAAIHYFISTTANLTVSVTIHYCAVLRELIRIPIDALDTVRMSISRMAITRVPISRKEIWRRIRSCFP